MILLQKVLEVEDLDLSSDLNEESDELMESLSEGKKKMDLTENVQLQISRSLSVGDKSKSSVLVVQKENDKEVDKDDKVEPAPITRIVKLNASEWPYLITGMIFAALVGAFPVLFSLILSELIKVRRQEYLLFSI